MRPHCLVVDDWFRRPDQIRFYATTLEYKEWVDPSEAGTKEREQYGASEVYPGVSTLTDPLRAECIANLEGIFGAPNRIDVKSILLRLNKAGDVQPHFVHTDIGVARWSLTVYLSDPKDCKGGLILVRHRETGKEVNPTTREEENIWRRDQKNLDAWQVLTIMPAVFNRGIIFPAELYHCSLPTEGYGQSAQDGRLTLNVFFNVREGL